MLLALKEAATRWRDDVLRKAEDCWSGKVRAEASGYTVRRRAREDKEGLSSRKDESWVKVVIEGWMRMIGDGVLGSEERNGKAEKGYVSVLRKSVESGCGERRRLGEEKERSCV